MIRRHDFNSEWWGEDVGIVFDPAFFELPPNDRSAELQRFVWVEFVDSASRLPSRRALADAGFFHTDTQIRFRLDLRQVSLNECSRKLTVQSATDSVVEMQLDDIRPFLQERFYVLPGSTEARIRERYRLWASRLVSRDSATCLRISLDSAPQGWFLAEQEDNGLKLTLAMLSTRATISGYDLYAGAVAHFAQIGHQLGFASFSARNSSVLNIYSRLGARFVEPRECWIWINPRTHIV